VLPAAAPAAAAPAAPAEATPRAHKHHAKNRDEFQAVED
jgi:hypothetical protein